jgi:RHS repeat-associated protein
MPDVNHPTLLVTDQHASVLKVIHAARQHPIAYGPFGHAIHSRQQTLCGFNGQIHEQHAGTYLLGHGYRGFSTGLLRFKGPDSLSPFGAGGLNAYAYCQAEPVNHVDPSGHAPKIFNFFKRRGATVNITPYRKLTPPPQTRIINKSDVAKFRSHANEKYDLNLSKKESKAVFNLIARKHQNPPAGLNPVNFGQARTQSRFSSYDEIFNENLQTLKNESAIVLGIQENRNFRININDQSHATKLSLTNKLNRKKLAPRNTNSAIRE